MKIDTTRTLKGHDGNELMIKLPGSEQPVKGWNIKTISVFALENSAPNEQIAGLEKFRRSGIAHRISTSTEVELEAGEVALIKELAAKMFPASVVGPFWNVMEGRDDYDFGPLKS